MPIATVTSKGQVTIPKAIRDRLAIHEGDQIMFSIDDLGNVVLRPAGNDGLDAVQGLLRHLAKDKPVSVSEMRESVRRRAAKKGVAST